MASDLHLHSTFSDGSLRPAELFDLCATRGLTTISLVDHDRVDHLPPLLDLATSKGLRLITGVEISAIMPQGFPGGGRKVHILGYHVDPRGGAIEGLCGQLLRDRHAHSLATIERMLDAGLRPNLEAISLRARDSGVIYKQHIMADLVEQGQADSLHGLVYKRFFKDQPLALPEISYVNALDAIRAITEDGGIAVLAHPSLYDSWECVESLVNHGLGGIETSHPSLGEVDSARAVGLARVHGLIQTGGSDHHGSYGDEPLPGTKLVPQGDERSILDPHAPRLARGRTLVVSMGRKLMGSLDKSMTIAHKDGGAQDLVTNHDHAMEAGLRKGLLDQFPQDDFWGEEDPPSQGEDALRGGLWIVDPIDGTSNFINLRRDFSVSVGFCSNGEHRFGLVYDPAKDVLYQGLGPLPELGLHPEAWVNGVPCLASPGEKTSTEVFLDSSLNTLAPLSTLGLDLVKLSKDFRGHRSLGCASLAIINCGLGNLGVYASVKVSIWDWAGAINFLEALGGSLWIGGSQETTKAYQRVCLVVASSRGLLDHALMHFGPTMAARMHSAKTSSNSQ